MPLSPEFHELAQRVNNWGRWGADDEIGTLNLIGDEVVRRAAAAVRTGRRISLAVPLSPDGLQVGNIPGRTNPEHRMVSVNMQIGRDPDGIRFSEDAVAMPLQAATHWDGLAHVSYSGRVYNGFGADVVDDAGARRLGIHNVRTLVSRGVLLDVARVRGVDRLEGGDVVTPEDLDAAADLAGVRVEPGDVVLIRTGHIRLLRTGDKESYARGDAPGPGMACAGWFREHDVAAVATDTIAFEVWPVERRDTLFPLHLLDLVEMGLTQGQNFDLEDLAEAGATAFLLEASPQPFVRALGSPVNPVAIL